MQTESRKNPSVKKRIFIEAGPIAIENRSGVGHVAYRMTEQLAADAAFVAEHEIILVTAFNKVHLIEEGLRNKVTIRKIYLPGRIMNGLVRFNLMFPMDIFVGKGTYIFFNFKNWPLFFSKSITYIHDVYFKVQPDHIEPRNRDLLERNLQRFISRSDAVVAVSEHAKSEVERFYPDAKGKTNVIYNAIDADHFYPRDTAQQKAVAAKYGLTPKNYFMFLSNIEPRKNIVPLLDAYKKFIDTTKSTASLILIGGMGWNNGDIMDRIKTLKDGGYAVILPDEYVPDDDLPALLSGAIALAHPAIYEGFGMPILEAVACGTPVIVGNNSSIPEVVGPDYAEYVDVTNPDDISSRMIQLYEHPSTAEASLTARTAIFTWTNAKDKLITLIKKLETKR